MAEDRMKALVRELQAREKVVAVLCGHAETARALGKLIRKKNGTAKVWNVFDILNKKPYEIKENVDELVRFFRQESPHLEGIRLIIVGDDLVPLLDDLLADPDVGKRIIPPILVLCWKPADDLFLPKNPSPAHHPSGRPPLPSSYRVLPLRLPVRDLGPVLDRVLEAQAAMPEASRPSGRKTRPSFSPMVHWNIYVFDDEVDRYDTSHLKEVLEEVFGPLHQEVPGVLVGDWSPQGDKKYRLVLNLRGVDFAVKLLHKDLRVREEIRDGDIDLVLVDIRFGATSYLEELGLEVISEIRKLRKDLPIFVLSGYGEVSLFEQAVARGARSYYQKPPRKDSSAGEPHGEYGGREPARLRSFDRQSLWEGLEAVYGSPCDRYYSRPARRDFIVDRTGRFWERIEEEALQQEVVFILNAMFGDYHRVEVIKTLDEGLSGNKTFFVRPIKRPGDRTERSREIEYNPRLVKIGPRFEIAYEEERYNFVIDGYLDTFVGMVVKDSYVEAKNLAGIMYTSVGASKHYIGEELEYPKTFRQFIEDCLEQEQRGFDEIRRRFDGIYTKILHGLYRNRQVRRQRVLAEYGQLLPALLTLRYSEAEECREFDLEVVEDREDKRFVRFEELRREMLGLRQGEPVRILNGRVAEVGGIGDPGRGKIRLFHPDAGLKIDVLAPDPWTAGFKELIEDRRLRRGKILKALTGKVEKNVKAFLRERLKGVLEGMGLSFLTYPSFEQPFLDNFTKVVGLQELLPEESLRERPLPEPIAFVFKTFDYHYTCEMTYSTIHGDLNLGNLLIAGRREDEIDYWLVDFAKAREDGPTAFEFAKLEVEIRTQVLSKILHEVAKRLLAGGDEREEVYKGLLAAYLLWERSLGSFLDPEKARERYSVLCDHAQKPHVRASAFLADPKVKDLFLLVGYIRGKAMATLEERHGRIDERLGLEPEEYLCALIFYSISCLKFDNLFDRKILPSAPLPALLAYLCCAEACRRLRDLVPHKVLDVEGELHGMRAGEH